MLDVLVVTGWDDVQLVVLHVDELLGDEDDLLEEDVLDDVLEGLDDVDDAVELDDQPVCPQLPPLPQLPPCPQLPP